MSRKLSISKAIGEALHEEMARDENVIIMGEDMGKMGNVFGITVGFQEEFGEHRVYDTPNPVSVAWRLARRCAAYVR